MIVVLEDMEVRIRALKRWIGEAPLVWCKTVKEFEAAMLANPNPKLVILDHDLGGEWDQTSPDVDGRTGMDAIQFIPEHSEFPVLIWSCSPARRSMIDAVVARGVAGVMIPFWDWQLDQLEKFVKQEIACGDSSG